MRAPTFVLVPLLAAALAGCQWWPGGKSRSAEASPSPSPQVASAASAAPSPGDGVSNGAAPAQPAEAAPGPAERPPRSAPAERRAGVNARTETQAAAQQAPAPPEAAGEPEPAPPAPTPEPIVLAAGAELPILLHQTLASDTSRTEQEVSAELAADVTAQDRVVLPAGTEVIGHVVFARQSGRVKGRARLVVSFDEIRLEGKSYAISAAHWDVTAASSRNRDAKIAGGAAVAGALIGAIAGGGKGALRGGLIGGAAGGAAVLVTRGNEVELRSGARYKITLRSSLRLD